MKAFILDGAYGKYKAIPVNIYDDKGNEVVDVMEAGYFLLGEEDDTIYIVERNGFLYSAYPSLDMLDYDLDDVVVEALKNDGHYLVQLDDDDPPFDDDWDSDERYREYQLIVIKV